MVKKEDLVALGVSMLVMCIPLLVFFVKQPSEIPVHWGLEGPDRFVPSEQFPLFVLFLSVIILTVWGARFVFPLGKNVEKFRRAYNGFVVAFALLLAILLSASVEWASGGSFDIYSVVFVVVGTALGTGGAVMYVSKRNWAVGFRNPWTLSSDEVWGRINKEAGVFTTVVGALVVVFGVLGYKDAVFSMLFLLLAGYALITVHSYILWRREQ